MKQISSKDNSLIQELSILKEKKYREEKQCFLIEGYHLVEEAYKASCLDKVFIVNDVDNHFENVDTYLVNETIIKKLSSTQNPQNIVGVVRYLNNVDLNELCSKDVKLILLDDVADPGNMGTIIRTSAALGYDGIISSLGSVDYYNDKVIRSSEGAIFKLPLLKKDLIETIKYLKAKGLSLYTTSLKATVSLDEIKPHKSFMLVFGNEAHGVSDEIINLSDERIIIPMDNDVESLNVAVSAGIIMYELKKLS